MIRTSSNQSRISPQTNCDPYNEPGNLYSADELHDSRYIIYNDPIEQHSRHPRVPPKDWVIPSLSSEIHQLKLEKLTWMSNRTILLIGDSIDRNLVIHFGRRALAGSRGTHQFFIPPSHLQIPNVKLESHQIGVAHLPELNLTVYNWFLMGLSVSEEVPFFHPREDLPQDFQLRLQRFYLPLLTQRALPIPDLVIFNTGFWDLEYLARARSAHHPLGPPIRPLAPTQLNSLDLGDGNPLTLAELAFHRTRLVSFIKTLKHELETLVPPQVHHPIKFMYRSMQLGNATQRNAFSQVRVRQLDQSNQSVMKLLKIPVLDWGKMTIGLDHQLSDPPIVSVFAGLVLTL